MKTLFFLALVHVLNTGNTEIKCKKDEASVAASMHCSMKINTDTATLNGVWWLIPILASDTAAGKFPVLQINLKQSDFTGNTGCNTMHGSFQKTDSSLVFNKNIVTTKMMCTGYDEAAFVRNLLLANRYKIENGELVLMFNATELSRWSRKPNRQIKINRA